MFKQMQKLSKTGNQGALQLYSAVGNRAALQFLDPASESVIQLTAKQLNPTIKSEYYNVNNDGSANISEVQNKNEAGRVVGSAPGVAQPCGWNQVPAHARGLWIRFHLVNQQIGGKGANYNLVPTTQATNHNSIWRNFETAAQHQYNAGRWIWCKVQVTGYHQGNPGFPSDIMGHLESYNEVNQQWNLIANVNLNNIPQPPNFVTGVIQVGNMTANDWRRVLNDNYLTVIHEALADKFGGKTYTDYPEFDTDLYAEDMPDIDTDPIYTAIIGNHPTININIF